MVPKKSCQVDPCRPNSLRALHGDLLNTASTTFGDANFPAGPERVGNRRARKKIYVTQYTRVSTLVTSMFGSSLAIRKHVVSIVSHPLGPSISPHHRCSCISTSRVLQRLQRYSIRHSASWTQAVPLMVHANLLYVLNFNEATDFGFAAHWTHQE